MLVALRAPIQRLKLGDCLTFVYRPVPLDYTPTCAHTLYRSIHVLCRSLCQVRRPSCGRCNQLVFIISRALGSVSSSSSYVNVCYVFGHVGRKAFAGRMYQKTQAFTCTLTARVPTFTLLPSQTYTVCSIHCIVLHGPCCLPEAERQRTQTTRKPAGEFAPRFAWFACCAFRR